MSKKIKLKEGMDVSTIRPLPCGARVKSVTYYDDLHGGDTVQVAFDRNPAGAHVNHGFLFERDGRHHFKNLPTLKVLSSPYYFVYGPQSGPPRFQHTTEESARIEAERLARENPGKPFVVLAPVCISQSAANPVVTTEL